MTEPHIIYEAVAKEFDRDRSKDLMEVPYLREIVRRLPGRAEILDLGCGTAEPSDRAGIATQAQICPLSAARPDYVGHGRPHAFWSRLWQGVRRSNNSFAALFG